MAPEDLKFAKTHEWVAENDGVATVGISDFAVKLLTDIVFIDLPTVGTNASAGETIGEIESVKAVSDLYAPVSGEIVAVNDDLLNDLSKLSDSPYKDGWICRIRREGDSSGSELMDAAAYQKHCESESH